MSEILYFPIPHSQVPRVRTSACLLGRYNSTHDSTVERVGVSTAKRRINVSLCKGIGVGGSVDS